MEFTAVYLKAPEGGYVAWVEELPGANTQGETLEETRANLREAVTLMLEFNRETARAFNRETAEADTEGEVIREPLTLAS